MVVYQGGKFRIGKRIYTVIIHLENYLTKHSQIPSHTTFNSTKSRTSNNVYSQKASVSSQRGRSLQKASVSARRGRSKSSLVAENTKNIVDGMWPTLDRKGESPNTGLGKGKLPYFEPFVGMGSVIKHFDSKHRKLCACDINKDLILMFKEGQKGWIPPSTVSRIEFEYYKKQLTAPVNLNDAPEGVAQAPIAQAPEGVAQAPEGVTTYNSKNIRSRNQYLARRGFVGIVSCFNGNYYSGYRLNSGRRQKYVQEGMRSFLKLIPEVRNVKFYTGRPYYNWNPKGMLIYCDPPYKGNHLSNSLFTDFDHNAFWSKMNKWAQNNIVIISESSAPDDWKIIWTVQSQVKLSGKSKAKEYTDNLYVHKSIWSNLDKDIRDKMWNS